jgi:hypothetical protein
MPTEMASLRHRTGDRKHTVVTARDSGEARRGGAGAGYVNAVNLVLGGEQGGIVNTLGQGEQIMSSELLQKLIYFNAYYSLAHGVLGLLTLRFKALNGLSTGLAFAAFAIWAIVEALRLYAGTVGNLKEKVPHLVGFFLLSAFPQLPVLVYLLAFQEGLLPIEQITTVLEFAFVLLEAGVGYAAIRDIVRDKTARFSVEAVAPEPQR